ncbi:spermidine/putrescine ABC transporter substrate-binding protein [Paenibacillus melissococcoides]|uniref:Spermidine/putrescine ABC transporter substrate-binding protein n=2 Tax=Paenibacillus TaxID=44249 RepID=A0ABM9G6K7_9BACL|nr:spermidine/putrescine ABC transporter substrate-binding protein [Paenibacillus melissococcoides]CAH8705172.1 spermidine/putrescine ABC transporter substrate-binding protein [Paenibacillus melissococcoides]CAH8714584.1 spermidine/putrescine ABC transporter substrate-binding protein [Paenibacillus melissococcoides]
MKWFAAVLAGVLTISALAGCSASKDTLNLYTWADNFNPEMIEKFESENNVKVNMAVFANNEELLAKIKAGGANYDLIQPSDYMVASMIKQDLLETINKDNIPNFQYVVDRFKNPAYDPNSEHSIIYMWGVTGIAYNKKHIAEAPTSWADLWKDEYKGKVLLLDDNREIIGMALKKAGKSNSTDNEADINAAADDLRKLVPNVVAFDTDNIKQKMIQEEGWIGTVWSGDAAFIAAENPDIAYVIPQEGSTIFADTYAIPKGAKNKELAEKFINFMLDPENSAKNYEFVGYSNPVTKAKEFHSEEYLNNPMINLTDEELGRTEWLLDVGKSIQLYDRLWTELKSGR